MLSREDHVLLLTAHHSILDGLALDVVLKALAKVYQEPDRPLAVATGPAPLAARQRRELASGTLARQPRLLARKTGPAARTVTETALPRTPSPERIRG